MTKNTWLKQVGEMLKKEEAGFLGGAEVSKVKPSLKRWAESEVPTSCTRLEQVKVTTSLKRCLDAEGHVTKNAWLKQVGEMSKKEEARVLVGAEVPVTFTISLKR